MTPSPTETAGSDLSVARRVMTPGPDARTEGGIVHGTLVLTQRGEVGVQDLRPGDKVISRNAGLARLTGMLQRCVTLNMISVTAGSLGHTRPEQDMCLPAGQQVLIRDWRADAMFGKPRALVPARDLVDGEFILDIGPCRERIYHLQFDCPQVIYAGGLELACGDWPEAEIRPAA